MKHIIVAMVFGVLITATNGGAGLTQDFYKGLEAARTGDFQTALREWRPLAEEGDPGSQFNLGMMYTGGNGVPQDFKEALRWYRKSAEQGYNKAQFHVGIFYAEGRGVPQDYVEAMKWYRKAAEQGYGKAQINLAVEFARLYAQGDGSFGNDRGSELLYAYMWASIAASNGAERGEEA